MLVHKDWDNIVHYFPVQSCSWHMGQRCTGNFLVQCWHMQIKTTLYRLFSCENVYAPDLHCASNYPVQCCLRRVWTTLNGQYFYAMLSQHGRYNTAQVFFLIKGVCLPWANIAQLISLCNFDPERSGHRCRLFSSAKLFVDCTMIGGKMTDPLTAGK